MTPGQKLAITLVTTALAAAVPALAQDVTALLAARDQLKVLQDRWAGLERDEQQKCALAKTAFSTFALETGADLAPLALRAQAAAQARDACMSADKAAKEAKDLLDASWIRLKTLLPLPAAPTVLAQGVQELIDAAEGAQDRVDTARSNYADPYEAGDSAAVKFLKSADLEVDDRKKYQELVQQARDSAGLVRRAVSAAQVATNSLVKQAMLLKRCNPDCTDDSIRLAAQTALTQLTAALSAAESEFGRAKENSLVVTAGVTYKDATDRENAIAFARVLDTFPDARSVLGEASAVGLTASGTSTVATVKLGGAKNLPFGWRQTSFTLSTPLDSNKNPRLIQHGAGFNDAASLGISRYWVLGGTGDSIFKGKTYLSAAGLKGSVGLGGKLSYLLDDLKTEQQAQRLFREGSVGAYVAQFRQDRKDDEPVGSPRVHLLSVDLKRSVKLGDEETRCPVPSATAKSTRCVTAYFTAPSFEYSRQVSYEYRYQYAKWVIAPKVKYEDRDSTTTLRVPFYWIRSNDPAAKGAFNAGVDWVWSRGRSTDGKRITESTVGMFVGMPFSLGAVDRD